MFSPILLHRPIPHYFAPTDHFIPQIQTVHPSEDDVNINADNTVMVFWEPPPFLCFKLNIDGCSKGNPGEACSGGILRDFAGRFVVGFTYPIGFQRAITSEFHALYQGLKLSLRTIGPNATLLVETDSTEVWSVVQGNHGPEYQFAEVVESCREIMKSFRDVRIRHVYREANRAADFLANEGVGCEIGELKVWKEPRLELQRLIFEDQMGLATPRLCKGVCKQKFYF